MRPKIVHELLVFAVLASCSKGGRSHPSSEAQPSSDRQPPASPVAQLPSTQLSPAAAPQKAASTQPLAEKSVVERTDAKLYALATANVAPFGKLDGGRGTALSDDQLGSGVVAGGRDKGGEVKSWTLFDLDGRTLATFPHFYTGASKLKKAVVGLANGRQALLDAKTGAITSPDVSLPGRVEVDDTRIVLDDGAGQVWVFARGKDGKGYAGTWDDLAQAKVTLSTSLERFPEFITTDDGVLAWNGDHPTGCDLFTLSRGAPPRCAPLEHEDDTITGDELVAGRYWVGRQHVIDSKTQKAVPLVPGCNGNVTNLASQPAGPRVLSACSVGLDVQLSLWSPTQTWATTASRYQKGDFWTLAGNPLDQPVYPIGKLFGKEPPYTDWIDVATATIYTTPPLAQVLYSEQDGMPERFLAQKPEMPGELWVVDLAAGAMERIASDLSCKHELHVHAETADRVALICAKETGRGYEAVGGWTEVIDFAARTRTRMNDVALTDRLDNGRLAGLTLTSPMRVVVTP